MTAAIRARGLTKTYGGGKGLFDLDLTVETGEIFGYLGPNGAGKTTTIRLMLDFIRPGRGSLEVLGAAPSARASRRSRAAIGYLPGELGLPESSTGAATLSLYAGLSGGGAPLRGWLCEALNLDAADLRKPVSTYSKGMKQKVGIVQAMQHDPRLLILDEPTGGLDPVVQARFFEVLREFRRRGRTIFFSSHVLSEVEAVCDRVGVLRDGRLVLDRPVPELAAEAGRLLHVRLEAPAVAPPASASPDLLPPRFGDSRFLRHDGAWLVYAVDPKSTPGVLRDLAEASPADFRLESALDQSLLALYGVGPTAAAVQHPASTAASSETPNEPSGVAS